MYYFIATAFFYLFPCALLLRLMPLLGNKQFWLRCLLVLQWTMIFHALFFVRQLIGLYQLAKTMGLKSHDYLPPLLESIQMGILVIWPFLAINKKLAAQFWTGIPLWLVLLSLPRFVSFGLPPLQLFVNFLFFISLTIGLYGFLWLLKRFPDQSKR